MNPRPTGYLIGLLVALLVALSVPTAAASAATPGSACELTLSAPPVLNGTLSGTVSSDGNRCVATQVTPGLPGFLGETGVACGTTVQLGILQVRSVCPN